MRGLYAAAAGGFAGSSVSFLLHPLDTLKTMSQADKSQSFIQLGNLPRVDAMQSQSQFHEFTGELTSKVNSHYLSRSEWLQLPNPTARRRI